MMMTGTQATELMSRTETAESSVTRSLMAVFLRREAMSDLITRARKEWCETPEPANYPASRLQRYTAPCPPEVVAALLDVLEKLNEFDVRMSHGGREALLAEAAIARALEGTPCS